MLDDARLARYSRHLLLPQIGFAGQERLNAARVLVVGAGGLGSPAAMYLVAAGVGQLRLADADHVELSNLQRQLLHRTQDVGRPKVMSGADTLHTINPHVVIEPLLLRLEDDALTAAVSTVDVVLDCSDNFATRFALNTACITAHTPWVTAAAIGFQGQITSFDPRRMDSPCYRCLYTPEGEVAANCSEAGVLAPAVGVIGCMQATEAIKLIVGCGQPLVGRLLRLDALAGTWRESRLRRDIECDECKNNVAMN